MKHWALGIISAPFLLALVLMVAAALYRTFEFEPAMRAQEKKVEQIFPKFEADLKALSEGDLFSNSPKKKNAAAFILQNVGWQSDDATQLTEYQIKLRELMKPFAGWIAVPAERAALRSAPNLESVNTGWISQLRAEAFDHVDISNEEAVRSILSKVMNQGSTDRLAAAIWVPNFNFDDIVASAKVHLAKGVRSGALFAALEDVRHLARLIQTDQSRFSQVNSISILRVEKIFAEDLQVEGLLPAGPTGLKWELRTQDELDRFRRVVGTWPAVIRRVETRGLPSNLAAYLEPRFGACLPFGAAAGMAGHSDYFVPQVPFESRFQQVIDSYRAFRISLQKKCGQEAWAAYFLPVVSEPQSQMLPPELGALEASKRTQSVPYLRRLFGMMLVQTDLENPTRFYAE